MTWTAPGPAPIPDGPLVGDVYSLRLVYAHLLAEYARHNGHADLLRECIDGTKGL